MHTFTLLAFIFVYLGMFFGRIPGLALDRTGVALIGAILLIATDPNGGQHFIEAIDFPTLALLFGLMVVSAQFRLGGFYTYIVRKVSTVNVSPPIFLGIFMALAGLLSAVLVNDIICLAIAPVVIEICSLKSYNPKIFLIALACAANIGSAATLIGNPQNMLIGQVLHLSFGGFILQAGPPSIFSLVVAWLIIVFAARRRWFVDTKKVQIDAPEFNLWQSSKGIVVMVSLIALFLWGGWQRELLALAGAGILLCSRRMRSRNMLALVDWPLLVLFMGLFVVNHALAETGYLEAAKNMLAAVGFDLGSLPHLFTASVVLSNLVSNVPSIMLLLPYANHPLAGPLLALSSTLAGNMLIVGSIANIIVVEQANGHGVYISWQDHIKIGVPVTLATLSISAIYLWMLS